MRFSQRKLLLGMACLASVGGLMTVRGADPAPGAATVAVIEAVTAPSDVRKLSFNFPGLIKDVMVKEGDKVKAGDPLMLQDDDIENAELDHLNAEATSEARIKYYEADYDVKKHEYERKSTAGEGAFSQSEIEQAKAEMIKAERQIDVANLDHAGDKSKAVQQGLKVNRLTLRSKIDGVVQKIVVRGGEYAEIDREKPAIVVVKNDPAWVEIKELKSWQVVKLTVGQTMDVRYPGEEAWKPATIVFIDPTTFAGTDNQLVRLELPNPENRATGMSIQVKLPDQVGSRERTASR